MSTLSSIPPSFDPDLALIRRPINAPKKPVAKELTFEEFEDGLNSVFVQAGPVLKVFMKLIDDVEPYITLVYVQMANYLGMIPEGLMPALFGLLFCFFGGYYPLTLAAIEALYICGGEQVMSDMSDIFEELKNIKLAFQKEDDDLDNSKVKHKQKTSVLMLMKSLKFFRLCKDPNKLSKALTGLCFVGAGVMATLQSQFAKVLTLSLSISNVLYKPIARNSKPILETVLPEDYKQWIDIIINWGLKGSMFAIAYWLTKALSTIQSGFRGGLMCARAVLLFMASKGYLEKDFDLNKTILDETIGFVLAISGISQQVLAGFRPHWALAVFLWPLSIMENILTWTLVNNRV